jgi:hypothetical protein
VPKRTRTSKFVLFVPCGGMGNASARTRVYAYLPYLERCGLRWHIASYTYHKYDRPTPRGMTSRLWLELLPLRNLIAFLKADTLFFQKKSIRGWMVRWGKLLKKRIVYDLDDALYLKPPEQEAGIDEHRMQSDEDFLPRLKWILERCDLALVSGDELARFAVQYADKVRILPSVMGEGEKSQNAEKPKSQKRTTEVAPNENKVERLVIGWVGAPENQRYLREIEPVLVRLQDEFKGLEVWIVTSSPMQPPPNFRYRHIPWSLEAERLSIPQFTVGIAPLADDPWCRAKMNFKALVYMSYRIPAVVSPVGFPVSEFENGKNVLLAESAEDWYLYLSELLKNPAKRQAIGAGGLKVVRERFSAEARAEEYAKALKG